MTKKRRPKRKGINRFRFETDLPPEAAMERLHDLPSVKHSNLEVRYSQTFHVKSKKLDGTIYFEIQVMGSAYNMPAMLGQTIRGQIRAIDSTRTLVEGDLQYSPQVKFFLFSLATILGGGSIWLFLSGSMPAEDLLTIVGITVVAIILIRVFATGKGGRNLSIDRIERQLRPRRNDHRLVAQGQALHLGKRSQRLGRASMAEEPGPVQNSQVDDQPARR